MREIDSMIRREIQLIRAFARGGWFFTRARNANGTILICLEAPGAVLLRNGANGKAANGKAATPGRLLGHVVTHATSVHLRVHCAEIQFVERFFFNHVLAC